MDGMLRFPNPGSDIGAFVRMFRALFQHLKGQPNFTLDDMSSALVSRNLATSSGHIGEEALRRSTRADRTRDPLFNQSKMYSELYRILGWIHNTPNNRQQFNFTFLGAHIASGDTAPQELAEESLLRITYPNPHVEVKGKHYLRPIATIIQMASELDGRISRDEIILGPLRLGDDRDTSEVAHAVELIDRLRKSNKTESAVASFAKQVSIQLNTLHNYTRFPLGILRGAKWTTPMRQGRGVEDVLTPKGAAIAKRIKDSHDVREDNIKNAPAEQAAAFIKLAFYQMMNATGYSLPKNEETPEALEAICNPLLKRLGIKDTSKILFSPFQECNPELLAKVFPPYTETSGQLTGHTKNKKLPQDRGQQQKPILVTKVKLVATGSSLDSASIENPIAEIILSHKEESDVAPAVEQIFTRFRHASKATFYPAVADLFKCLGFNCSCSRTGVNYQRMDAMISDPHESIPIEIKSPAEEEFLSVKGVRQALENKIVLLSRKYAPTAKQTTSLAVGFEPPNDRSEVSSLIKDIHATYGISIGIIDFRTLVRLAAEKLILGRTPDIESIRHLRGLLEIENS